MKLFESESVLSRISEHTGRAFTQNEAHYLSDNVPDWLDLGLALASVDQIAKIPTLDGSPPDITPRTIVDMAKLIRQNTTTADVPDDARSYPKSAGGKFAAAYTSVVERVMLTSPEIDFKVPGNYFWALGVATGVMQSSNNLRGEEYV